MCSTGRETPEMHTIQGIGTEDINGWEQNQEIGHNDGPHRGSVPAYAIISGEQQDTKAREQGRAGEDALNSEPPR